MSSEDDQSYDSSNDATENAQKLKEAISCFLKLISADDSQTYFDSLGLSLVIKELETFVDVIILVERNRYAGAKARLRSIWESFIILNSIIYCSQDKDAAAEALFLYDENKQFNIIKKNKFLNTLTREEQDDYQELADQYQSLNEHLKEFAKENIEKKYRNLVKNAPSAIPFIEVNSIKISQYDAVFRIFSRPAHGGLPGSRNLVQQWLDDKTTDQAFDEKEASGILCAGYLWLKDILEIWLKSSNVSNYQQFWYDCAYKI